MRHVAMPGHTQATRRQTAAGPQNVQGTLGGMKAAVGRRPGARQTPKLNDAAYLWLLVGLEVGAIVWLRRAFRRHHGG